MCVITARVRSTTGGYVFTSCVSVRGRSGYPSPWFQVPSQPLVPRYPCSLISAPMSLSQPLARGTPVGSQDQGYPLPTPLKFRTRTGVPQPGPGQGTARAVCLLHFHVGGLCCLNTHGFCSELDPFLQSNYPSNKNYSFFPHQRTHAKNNEHIRKETGMQVSGKIGHIISWRPPPRNPGSATDQDTIRLNLLREIDKNLI